MAEPFQIDKFFELVGKESDRHPLWRYGQVLWSILFEYWPDIAYEIMNDNHFDPFYYDDGPVIDRLIDWLIKRQLN